MCWADRYCPLSTTGSIEHETDEFYHTHRLLDVGGNLRKITDARGNNTMKYKFDMLGNKV